MNNTTKVTVSGTTFEISADKTHELISWLSSNRAVQTNATNNVSEEFKNAGGSQLINE